MTMHNSVLQHELSKLPDDTLVFIESRGETHRIAGITVQRVRIYDDGTHRSADDDEQNDDWPDSTVRDCVVIEADTAGD